MALVFHTFAMYGPLPDILDGAADDEIHIALQFLDPNQQVPVALQQLWTAPSCTWQ